MGYASNSFQKYFSFAAIHPEIVLVMFQKFSITKTAQAFPLVVNIQLLYFSNNNSRKIDIDCIRLEKQKQK